MKKKLSTITICSSAAFYKEVIKLEELLEKRGFKVLVPTTAHIMKKTGNYNVASYKIWFKDPKNYKKKTQLMDGHFKKVAQGDSILVVNNTKHGIEGYIGGNVLMEIALAHYLKKKIYILNKITKDSPIEEEILGVNPIFLGGDINKIK